MIKKIRNNVSLFRSEQVTEDEDGLHFSATLKNFTRPNSNGELAEPTAYDEFVSSYYGENGYQLPLCLQHDEHNIIGCVTELSRDEETMTCRAVVLKSAPNYAYIVELVKRGILGGVSDGSLVVGDFDEKTEIFHVRKGAICEVSLVTVPAEIEAGVKTSNTVVSGFGSEEKQSAFVDGVFAE